MNRTKLTTLIMGIFTVMACGHSTRPEQPSSRIEAQTDIIGDSTIYGLACDGCTDTILVLLRDIRSNPDTLNILNASRRHKVYGRLGIGDKVAVVRSATDSTVADLVIDIESLRGKWCYEVMPTLRRRADMPEQSHEQLLKQMPDSMREALMVPREYGFHIMGERNIRAIGTTFRTMSSDEESPVEYPEAKRYRDWYLYNGMLVLSETKTDSLGQQHITHSDTAQLVMLRPDTLVLRFGQEVRGYYNKTDL